MEAFDYPDKIGLIAGSGDVPQRVVQACMERGIGVFIVALEGHADKDLVLGHTHLWARLGAAGTIIKALKAHEIRDLVLVGGVKRPSFSGLMPDAKALSFFAKSGIKALKGDDSLLTALRQFLADEGFIVHGAHNIARSLLAPEGVLTKRPPCDEETRDIERGIEVVRVLGAADVGQGAVIQQGLVLALEAIEGTDLLLERAGSLKRDGRGGVFVKLCKPQQDRDLDMPAFGLETIRNAHQAGLTGVVLHAQQTLFLNQSEVIDYADAHNMFIIGINL